jgi:hypothetical protein
LSDSELARQFRALLRCLRPKDYLNRIAIGRKGRPNTMSGIDLLNQLAVYRFQKSGGNFETRQAI